MTMSAKSQDPETLTRVRQTTFTEPKNPALAVSNRNETKHETDSKVTNDWLNETKVKHETNMKHETITPKQKKDKTKEKQLC